ncbi:MAG: hypothetical protein NW237_13795 [Cyanobacteriota bacterium]|nr:hypothetical protein [Cyanobacteriota bacterium]
MQKWTAALWLGISLWGSGCWLAPPTPAQQQFNLGTSQLQQGTVIPVSSSSANQPQYFSPDTVYPLTLTVAQNIFDANGRLVLPIGSRISGQMEPATGGSRFVGTSIQVNGRTYSMRASSPILPDEKDPRQYSSQSVAEDAAIGAAAGAVLGILTGGVSTTGVIGGAAAGVVTGNVTAPQVVVLRPGQSFTLTLESSLRL